MSMGTADGDYSGLARDQCDDLFFELSLAFGDRMTEKLLAVSGPDINVVPRPYPERTEPLPKAREQINADWLTRTLRRRYPGVVALHFQETEFINTHTSKLRFRVGWNDEGARAGLPAHMCIKMNLTGAWNRTDIHALEARFYHFLAAEMQVPTAKCYYADWEDDGSGHGLVVLEDLYHRGGRFGHTTDQPSVEDVCRMLEGLALLHGSLWESPKLDSYRWLQTSMDTMVDNEQGRMLWSYFEDNLKRAEFRALTPRHILKDPHRVEHAYDKLVARERALSGPRCVIVGDCHPGNTYLLSNGERLWLDWQLVRRGRPWRDLTYLLIGSLSVDDRRRHQRELLEFYRDRLVRTGAARVSSAEEIYEQFRVWAVYGVIVWASFSDEWGQKGLPMNERFFAAAEDLDTWAILLGD
jgi:hypothetical protein